MPTNLENPTCLHRIIEEVLLNESLCDSSEEALAIVSSIDSDARQHAVLQFSLTEVTTNVDAASYNFIVRSLQEYLGVSESIGQAIWVKCQNRFIESTTQASDNNILGSDSDSTHSGGADIEEEEPCNEGVDEDSIIGLGACQLCERDGIKLTRHHMIPKSTYAQIEPKLMRVVYSHLDFIDEIDSKKDIIDEGLGHLIDAVLEKQAEIRVGKSSKVVVKRNSTEYRRILHKATRLVLRQQTIDICRPCHSMIHKTHGNMSLALDYNTLEKILQDETIFKHCKWLHKQKQGQYSLR